MEKTEGVWIRIRSLKIMDPDPDTFCPRRLDRGSRMFALRGWTRIRFVMRGWIWIRIRLISDRIRNPVRGLAF